MKVLMFGWEFPPYMSGGLGTACLGLTKGLSALDVNITFVLPKIQGEYHNSKIKMLGPENIKVEDYEDDNICTERFGHVKKYLKVDSFLHPYMDEESYKETIKTIKQNKEKHQKVRSILSELSGNYGEDLFSEVVRYSKIARVIAIKEEFDVIHAHDWMTYLAGIEAKKQSGKSLIVHIHATEFDRSGDNINQDIYAIEKAGFEMADRIIAVSYRTKDMVIKKYGIRPDKVSVVHNGVESHPLQKVERKKLPSMFNGDRIVLFLGRITMQKGPEYFIEAAQKVIEKVPNIRFVMAGSGDMARKMIEKMASLKIQDKFHFTGFLEEEERDRLFAMSDLYIMPSVSEPFGITPLEAMRYNIPIIISKQSGISEIVDHVTKIDFWDVSKMSKAIIKILKDPNREEKIEKLNQKALERINWDKSAKSVLDIYSDMCLKASAT